MARKILLADDSVTAQNMGRKILSDAGYEVITVNNGSAALKKIAESLPELIVLDVYMPGYSGLEVCQRLKETRETARIPVLLTVGKLEPFKPEDARRARADAFIVKPFEASELLTALTKLEDKIVPQPAHKTGQFAKAWAELEQTGEQKGEKFGDSETGWKNRLNIPGPGKKREEPELEEVAPKAKDSKGKKEKEKEKPEMKPLEVKPAETLTVAGVPTDITPEEVAAIAAAAAAFEEKSQATPAEFAVKAPEPAEQPVVAEAPGNPVGEAASPLETAAKEAAPAAAETKVSAAEAPAAVPEPAPVAAKPVGPRWTAQEVPLNGEASVSLEEEMSRISALAQAATALDAVIAAAAETPVASSVQGVAGMPISVVPAEPAPTEARPEVPIAVAPPEPVKEEPVAEVVAETKAEPVKEEPTIVVHQLETVQEDALAVSESKDEPKTAKEEPSVAIAQPEVPEQELAVAVITQPEPAKEEPVVAAVSQAEPVPAQEEAVVTVASQPEPEPPKEAPEAAVSQPETEPVSAVAAAASAGPSPNAAEVSAPAASEPVPSAAPETKGGETELAAAWAQWKQIRETVVGSQLTSQIADAAAASLAQADATSVPAEEESSSEKASASGNPSNIANIVDSVLAELKPKLVEEIARKLGDEKSGKKKKK